MFVTVLKTYRDKITNSQIQLEQRDTLQLIFEIICKYLYDFLLVYTSLLKSDAALAETEICQVFAEFLIKNDMEIHECIVLIQRDPAQTGCGVLGVSIGSQLMQLRHEHEGLKQKASFDAGLDHYLIGTLVLSVFGTPSYYYLNTRLKET